MTATRAALSASRSLTAATVAGPKTPSKRGSSRSGGPGGPIEPELSSFGAWALKIIQHRAIDSTRCEAIRPAVAEPRKDETGDQAAVSPPAELAAREQGDALRAALKRLPPAQAEIITLAYFGELSHSEIAERLAIPPGTVKGRMRLGMRKLRLTLRAPA